MLNYQVRQSNQKLRSLVCFVINLQRVLSKLSIFTAQCYA